MTYKLSIFIFIVLSSFQSSSFKKDQLRYSRVRQAYKEKEAHMLTLLQNKEIETDELRIYLRAFKKEKQLELWGKNSTDKTYQLIKTYDVCQSSGDLGPKREQGDYQVPEGFYHIDRFNPYSNFHLSLGLNYPNKSDKILGVKNNLGGDIFIHGACVTIGCLPITDEQIKELYIFCIEAKEHGQSKISITIFPSKLSKAEFSRLSLKYKTDSDKIELWKELKSGYDIFNQTHQLPTIGFLSSGRHLVN